LRHKPAGSFTDIAVNLFPLRSSLRAAPRARSGAARWKQQKDLEVVIYTSVQSNILTETKPGQHVNNLWLKATTFASGVMS